MKAKPDEVTVRRCKQLRVLGIVVAAFALWNGVADLVYGYSSTLSGLGYFSSAVWEVISTAGDRPHWMVMMAQSAGWLYPLFALSYVHWWVGTRRAGPWLSLAPTGLLAYAVLMIGGTQHTGWAFLSVLNQAKTVAGSTDTAFFQTASRFIVEHFVMGDLTAALALNAGVIWLAVAILSGKTMYPSWFVMFSPLGILVLTMLLGALLPAPFAGFVLAPFGTWVVLFPTIASTIWLWNRACAASPSLQ